MKSLVFSCCCTLFLLICTCIGLLNNDSCTIAFVVGLAISAFTDGCLLMTICYTQDKKKNNK